MFPCQAGIHTQPGQKVHTPQHLRRGHFVKSALQPGRDVLYKGRWCLFSNARVDRPTL